MTTRRQPFRDGVEAGDDALHSSPMEDGMMETVTNAAGRTVPASEVEIEVRYKETDQMGVVHHSNYLVWFELARTHHCRAAGMAYREIEDAGYWLMVTGVQLRYRGGARYGDRVRVRCWLESLKSRAVTFGYRVEVDGRLLVDGRTDHVWVDRESGNHCRMPEVVAPVFHGIAG